MPLAAAGDVAPNAAEKTIATWTIVLAVATLVLAVATLGLVVVTVWLTHTDRKRADEERKTDRKQAVEDRDNDRAQAVADRDEERKLAAKTLADERALADKRLADEREASDGRMREQLAAVEAQAARARQIDNAISLLARLAKIDPQLNEVANTATASYSPLIPQVNGAMDAIAMMKEGVMSEAIALNDETGSRLYTQFVQLLVDAVSTDWLQAATSGAGDLSGSPAESRREAAIAALKRTEIDLCRFSRYVRLSLRQLITEGSIPDDNLTALPILARAWHDRAVWTPSTLPPGWDEATQLDARDPQYRPPHQRR